MLVERWNDRVVDLAYRMTGDVEEARDVRQIALLRVIRHVPSFDAAATFSTWIYRVVLNLCLDRRRAAEARRRAESDDAAARTEPADDPARFTEASETARLVADAVGDLELDLRMVVVLKHYQGLTFAEIAKILGTPTSTVKSRMAQGLAILRIKLKHVDH